MKNKGKNDYYFFGFGYIILGLFAGFIFFNSKENTPLILLLQLIIGFAVILRGDDINTTN